MGATPTRSRGAELLEAWVGERKRFALSIEMRIDYGALCSFISGTRVPGPVRRKRIEHATSGAVPLASWDERGRRRAA